MAALLALTLRTPAGRKRPGMNLSIIRWDARCVVGRYAVLYFWRDAYTIPVIIVGGCWFAWRHQSATNTLIILPFRYASLAFWRYPYLLWSGGNQR